jgi:hypothetical protein
VDAMTPSGRDHHDSWESIPNVGWRPWLRWPGWLPRAAFMPEASSFPIFLRATMPQVQSPDTGEAVRCGRFKSVLGDAV